MHQYKVFNIRGLQVGTVWAKDDVEAIAEAKKLTVGPTVERVLTRAEEQQRNYEEEMRLWGNL